MEDKFNLDNSIKQELIIKAGEAKPSAEMLPRIINRIEAYEGGKENMLKDRMPNIMIKKLAIVSLCAVLLISGVMFTFSEDVRAAAMDAIRTIFVLDKTEDGYAMVEKTDQDELFTLMASGVSTLSDEELAKKVGFQVSIPKELYGGYKLVEKREVVTTGKTVSYEASKQLGGEIQRAVKDDATFNSLSEYKPYRSVDGIYKNESEATITIDVLPTIGTGEPEGTEVTLKTNAGNIKGLWVESAWPEYGKTGQLGLYSTTDVYTKPEGIVKVHSLRWELNGVRYYLNNQRDEKLTMEEAVKIAESFIAQQQK
jgi:hypothetical protein